MKIFNSRYLFSKQSGLRTLLEKEIIPERKQSIYYFIVELTELRKKNGEKVIGQVKVDDAVLGMRGVPVMLYDGSSLDPIQGILPKSSESTKRRITIALGNVLPFVNWKIPNRSII